MRDGAFYMNGGGTRRSHGRRQEEIEVLTDLPIPGERIQAPERQGLRQGIPVRGHEHERVVGLLQKPVGRAADRHPVVGADAEAGKPLVEVTAH
jgi:hypothetical protein